jgi:hypothetical protein
LVFRHAGGCPVFHGGISAGHITDGIAEDPPGKDHDMIRPDPEVGIPPLALNESGGQGLG